MLVHIRMRQGVLEIDPVNKIKRDALVKKLVNYTIQTADDFNNNPVITIESEYHIETLCSNYPAVRNNCDQWGGINRLPDELLEAFADIAPWPDNYRLLPDWQALRAR